MQFDTLAEHKAFNSFVHLFPEWLTKMTKDEKQHKHEFVRHAMLQQATLKGFNSANLDRYSRIHKRGLTVDHIVPLWGVDKLGVHIVCGLNVPWNMQGQTQKENSKKANLFVDSREGLAIYLPHQLNADNQ